MKVSWWEYILRSTVSRKNSVGRRTIPNIYKQWREGGCWKCRTELSVTNLVKTFHSICQTAPSLGSLNLIAFVGRDKSHFSTRNTSRILQMSPASLHPSILLHFFENNTLSFSSPIPAELIPVWYCVKINSRNILHKLYFFKHNIYFLCTISFDISILFNFATTRWTYVVGSKSFQPDQLFKVTEIKQFCYFST